MKAAIVDLFDLPPCYGEVVIPCAEPGEVFVHVQAVVLSQLVRAQASGKHYSTEMAPGAGSVVGLIEDGIRVILLLHEPL